MAENFEHYLFSQIKYLCLEARSASSFKCNSRTDNLLRWAHYKDI